MMVTSLLMMVTGALMMASGNGAMAACCEPVSNVCFFLAGPGVPASSVGMVTDGLVPPTAGRIAAQVR